MAQPAHTKVTREDWVAAAVDALDEVAIDELRVLSLAERLSISRSSFYWYFDDLAGLQEELLRRWERNTESIVERTERQAPTITTACLGVFECWADGSLYDSRLDLAVRGLGSPRPCGGGASPTSRRSSAGCRVVHVRRARLRGR